MRVPYKSRYILGVVWFFLVLFGEKGCRVSKSFIISSKKAIELENSYYWLSWSALNTTRSSCRFLIAGTATSVCSRTNRMVPTRVGTY